MFHTSDHPLDRDNDPVADMLRVQQALERVANPDDLAMVASVLEDLAGVSEALHDHRDTPKVTFFGSARVGPTHPSYIQCRDLAALLAADGYTMLTGGGPGIMTAALEGAGAGQAMGVGIEFPFETLTESAFPTVVTERFLIRKLAMVRHVRAFVCGAGGIGTLDELYEVLALLKTGKKRPAPVVLLECEGSEQWQRMDLMVRCDLVAGGLAKDSERALYKVCTTVEEAHEEIRRFYSRYVTLERGEPGRWEMWLRTAVDRAELSGLRSRFADLVGDSLEARSDASGHRLVFTFDQHSWGRVRELIDAVNDNAHNAGRDVA